MFSYLESKGLEEEGLLRKCGSASRVKAMVDTIESRFHSGVFSLEEYMARDKERKTSDVTSLLKQFLRCVCVRACVRVCVCVCVYVCVCLLPLCGLFHLSILFLSFIPFLIRLHNAHPAIHFPSFLTNPRNTILFEISLTHTHYCPFTLLSSYTHTPTHTHTPPHTHTHTHTHSLTHTHTHTHTHTLTHADNSLCLYSRGSICWRLPPLLISRI